MNLLLISNSTKAGEPFLQYPLEQIAEHLKGITEILFIPYAAVTFSYNDYEAKVQKRFEQIGIKVKSIHHSLRPAKEALKAKAICVGGGNTFALVRMMQKYGLMKVIRRLVLEEGIPYLGWSAGSNVACPTLCTTNDMPIVMPEDFTTLHLVKFQINPHYTDAHLEGHAGETREQRIAEYIVAHPRRYVVGLREGCMLKVTDNDIKLIGDKAVRIWLGKNEPMEVEPGKDLSFLL